MSCKSNANVLDLHLIKNPPQFDKKPPLPVVEAGAGAVIVRGAVESGPGTSPGTQDGTARDGTEHAGGTLAAAAAPPRPARPTVARRREKRDRARSACIATPLYL